MKKSNLLTSLAMALWGAAAVAQTVATPTVDFGARMSTISILSWLWALGIFGGGVLFRFALDIRNKTFSISTRYLTSTTLVCLLSGFIVFAFTESQISQGEEMHPLVQMAFMVMGTINHNIVLTFARTALEKVFQVWSLVRDSKSNNTQG